MFCPNLPKLLRQFRTLPKGQSRSLMPNDLDAILRATEESAASPRQLLDICIDVDNVKPVHRRFM